MPDIFHKCATPVPQKVGIFFCNYLSGNSHCVRCCTFINGRKKFHKCATPWTITVIWHRRWTFKGFTEHFNEEKINNCIEKPILCCVDDLILAQRRKINEKIFLHICKINRQKTPTSRNKKSKKNFICKTIQQRTFASKN